MVLRHCWFPRSPVRQESRLCQSNSRSSAFWLQRHDQLPDLLGCVAFKALSIVLQYVAQRVERFRPIGVDGAGYRLRHETATHPFTSRQRNALRRRTRELRLDDGATGGIAGFKGRPGRLGVHPKRKFQRANGPAATDAERRFAGTEAAEGETIRQRSRRGPP